MAGYKSRIRNCKGPIWLNSALLTGLKFFCDYMDDFNPGVETLYYTFSASIPGSKKKPSFCFLVINSHYHACSFSPGLKRL